MGTNPTTEQDGLRGADGKFLPGSKPNPKGVGGFQAHPELRNPGGRPKNASSITYWLNYFKNRSVKDFESYKKSHKGDMTIACFLAYERIKKASEDLKEFKEVANRTEGTPIQIDQIGTPDQPLVVLHLENP
jgi:hypothetical protein